MCPEPGAITNEAMPPQLVASPNGLDTGGIDIFQLPSERRVSQIASDPSDKTGMVMAVAMFHDTHGSRLVLCAGYEDGRVAIFSSPSEAGSTHLTWQRLSVIKVHTQPVLSLEALPNLSHVLSSSADATITRVAIPASATITADKPEKTVGTKHAGQQGLSVRCDGKIFATAGWDGRVRVYSCKTLKELAVLRWHKVGSYSTRFADVSSEADAHPSVDTSHPLGSTVPSSTDLVKPANALDVIKQQREDKARGTHWLAAGGKDGKISLWDVY
jgi:ASTRA-associated protein 1